MLEACEPLNGLLQTAWEECHGRITKHIVDQYVDLLNKLRDGFDVEAVHTVLKATMSLPAGKGIDYAIMPAALKGILKSESVREINVRWKEFHASVETGSFTALMGIGHSAEESEARLQSYKDVMDEVKLNFVKLTVVQVTTRKLKAGETRKSVIENVRGLAVGYGVEMPQELNTLLLTVENLDSKDAAATASAASGG